MPAMASSSSFSSRPSRPTVPEIVCPLCSYSADDESIIQLHFEAVHDNDSPAPPPVPPKREPHRWPPLVTPKPNPKPNPISTQEDDAYNPFRYQIPNNNSQEIVGAPVWRPDKVDKPTVPAAPAVSTPVIDAEPEYVMCEIKGCGEPVSLLELEEHIAMHEAEQEIIDEDDDDDDDDDYIDGNPQITDPVVGQRERKGDAVMDAASKKRYNPRKEGPSSRQPKKMGQMERRLESEAQALDGVLFIEEDEGIINVKKLEASFEPKMRIEDEGKEFDYDIINRDEFSEDEKRAEKQKEDGGQRFGSRHGKKLHKHNPNNPSNGYGGYEISTPRQSGKKSINGASEAGKSFQPVMRSKAKFKKSELGPYANEKRMPDWLKEALKEGGKQIVTKTIGPDGHVQLRKTYENETSGLIPVIRQLSALDPNVKKAYVCHPCVKHVYKEHPAANGFCGYRNIQMMASFCRRNFVPGCERLYGERIPTIIDIQKWIEQAWDRGINAHAREETGGILYTRKYIGSSEVEAMFTSFGTSTIPRQFSEPNQQINALRHVWNYFSNGFDQTDKVVQTDKAPIYFQHQGHSMTIVGIEQYKDGTLSFLCFDPMFSPSQNIRKLVGDKRIRSNIAHGKLLKPFRRGGQYLKRYSMFEMVELAPTFEPDSSLYE